MNRPKVLIVGAGFAGIRVAKGLAGADADVTVLDRRNHHLFQPLLYQIATAGLSPADIAVPIRSILRKQRNTEVLMEEVVGVDLGSRQVRTRDGNTLSYDTLVIATGSHHSYFGKDEWEKHAPGLKTVEDATEVRTRILTAFENAEKESDPVRRQAWMNFILVGGGPTGVEMAGSIAELSFRALKSDFRNIDPKLARVILVEAGHRVLAAFPEKLALRAQRTLEKLGVEIKAGVRVTDVNGDGVKLGNGENLPAKTIIWTAGVAASPAGHWLGTETDRVGRVMVGPDLTLPGHPEVFVIGDTAHVGEGLPGLAPVAMQEGTYVARSIRARLERKNPPGPFRYFNKGNLATIGRTSAIADLKHIQLSGLIGWLAWATVHIFYLVNFRNRALVMLQWSFSYLTFARGARLIVTPHAAALDPSAPKERPLPATPSPTPSNQKPDTASARSN